MNNVVVVDCIRTPMARSKGGAFRHVRAETLSAHIMANLIQRNPILINLEIEDIFWGCVQQTCEQGFNIARNAALLAGLSPTIPATTTNRLCGSSMQALHDGTRAIMVGDADCCLVGGVEHMGHLPMTHGVDFHPALTKYIAKAALLMGTTAEFLGREHQISRSEQDDFALRSHQKAAAATNNGEFESEIVQTPGHDIDGKPIFLQQDEVIRPDTNKNDLSRLSPVFDPTHGNITAGNSSALSDGASGMILMNEAIAKHHHLPIRAKIHAMAVAGCDPAIMGYGPVPASLKALKRANLTMADIELIELNEAFAAQALPCIKDLKLLNTLDDRVNIHGGAIALGHPLGCSGTRISTSLIHAMEQKDAKWGLATMCIGLGQGIATIFERSEKI